MKTKIYKSYEAFLKRKDKNTNGVSESFAAEHPDFENQNKNNYVGIVIISAIATFATIANLATFAIVRLLEIFN